MQSGATLGMHIITPDSGIRLHPGYGSRRSAEAARAFVMALLITLPLEIIRAGFFALHTYFGIQNHE